MTARRAAPTAALLGAVLADTVIATVGTAAPPAPVMTLATVVAVGLARGPCVGVLAGFVVGVVLDLLSGPVGLSGASALTCLAVGACAGGVARRAGQDRTGAAVAGGVLVPCGSIAGLSVHGLAGWAPAVALPLVAGAVVVGLVVTPLVRRWSGDLPVRSVPNLTPRA